MDLKNFKLSEFNCKCCGKNEMQQIMLDRLQALRDIWGNPMIVSSGYRCEAHNKKIGGAKNSAHKLGMAVDISDPDGELYLFCSEEILEKVDLYKEADTNGWVHIQCRPTSKRIFGR